MKSSSIRFSQKQIKYIMLMLEIDDPNDAIEAFAQLMAEERADPMEMPEFIDKIIARDKNNKT